MKKCSGCKVLLQLDKFGTNKTNYDSLQDYCRPCVKRINSEYYARNKEKMGNLTRLNRKKCYDEMNTHKAEVGCKLCPERDPCCLDYHHLNDKTKAVSQLAKGGCRTLMWQEIEKCVILCANCHRKVHAAKIVISPRC